MENETPEMLTEAQIDAFAQAVEADADFVEMLKDAAAQPGIEFKTVGEFSAWLSSL